MGKSIKKWLKINKELPIREEVNLNLHIASALIVNRFEKLIEPFGITSTQYNVLRILKGVYPDGYARCEIAERMIDKSSDVTRIIDRLEKQGLAQRSRIDSDRRFSVTKITKKGIDLVNRITPLLLEEHKATTKELTDKQCKELSQLLEKIYEKYT